MSVLGSEEGGVKNSSEGGFVTGSCVGCRQSVTVGRREQDSKMRTLMGYRAVGHAVRSWRTFSPM